MNFITQILRIFVGGLFIFSGLVKLNDPMGLSFKLHDYFAPDVLDLAFLNPYTLPLALIVIIVEVLLGVALLLGYNTKATLWLLTGMIGFFTFLTFYSAYYNKVTDCGCFGDAIPLTPWESFYKDVILSFAILLLWVGKKHLKPLLTTNTRGGIVFISLVVCVGIAIQVLNHLPFIDFRAYAEGKSLVEGMMSAEERGLEPTVYGTIYVLKNKQTEELKEVDSETYISDKWWEKAEWEIQDDLTKQVLISEGYEPPIHDFVILINDEDKTSSYLDSPALLFVIARNLDDADVQGISDIRTLVRQAASVGIDAVGATASSEANIRRMLANDLINYPMATMDETTLKTIVRSNPGVLLLSNGVVKGKWHYNDLPSVEELQSRL
jgi:uncharacterized membrane protein YphA (DoxX/SURF4 family)